MTKRRRRPPAPALPVVDLSLDFDFWVREDWRWDWGHGEGSEGVRGFMATVLWQHRYASAPFDLVAETDPKTHADFDLFELRPALMAKGLVLDRVASVGAAMGHESAYPFFTKAKGGPPDVLLQLDAHHDCFADVGKPMDCGNWLTHYAHRWPTVKLVQLYPKWKDPADDGEPQGATPTIAQWQDWPGLSTPYRVRHIFLCQSPGWTPPHLDKTFLDLIRLVGMFTRREPRQLGPLMDRTPLYEEGMAARPQMQKIYADFRAEQEAAWARKQAAKETTATKETSA